jgi:membrane-associated phospholipid phosphatase
MSGAFFYGFLLYVLIRSPGPVLLKALGAGWCLFAVLLAGPANIYVGVHWASDALGGYLWALVLLVPLFYADAALRAFPTDGSASPEGP